MTASRRSVAGASSAGWSVPRALGWHQRSGRFHWLARYDGASGGEGWTSRQAHENPSAVNPSARSKAP